MRQLTAPELVLPSPDQPTAKFVHIKTFRTNLYIYLCTLYHEN